MQAGRRSKGLWRKKYCLCIEKYLSNCDVLLGMRYFIAGDKVMIQLQGIPIGGPLSGAVLNLTLQRVEHLSDVRTPNRQSYYAIGRYVDDTVCISYTRCLRSRSKELGQGLQFGKQTMIITLIK